MLQNKKQGSLRFRRFFDVRSVLLPGATGKDPTCIAVIKLHIPGVPNLVMREGYLLSNQYFLAGYRQHPSLQ
jgi:hypothetical protein